MALNPGEIHAVTLYQLGALDAFLRVEGARLQHVKAHGALYTRIHNDPAAGEAFCEAVRRYAPQAILIVLAGRGGDSLARLAAQAGLRVAREAFPERAYTSDGQLAPRELPGSSIHDPAEAARRAVDMARGQIATLEGGRLELKADTLCIHGDNPQAVEIARAIREALQAAGYGLAVLDRVNAAE